ncbi:hypothetical protein Bbelb_017450 [Branchiostoma belcheri]|nr:hypothetical protein Bbelb_017450 [Branchiostoma belcheri]
MPRRPAFEKLRCSGAQKDPRRLPQNTISWDEEIGGGMMFAYKERCWDCIGDLNPFDAAMSEAVCRRRLGERLLSVQAKTGNRVPTSVLPHQIPASQDEC